MYDAVLYTLGSLQERRCILIAREFHRVASSDVARSNRSLRCFALLVMLTTACAGKVDGSNAGADNNGSSGTSGGVGGSNSGSGGTSGSSGASASGGVGGSSGAGGSGGTGNHVVQCQLGSDGDDGFFPVSKSHTIEGTNGSFTNVCDDQGNLVNYGCERACETPGCSPVQTGKVIPWNLDCSGHCVNATCDDRCPVTGQKVEFGEKDSSGNVLVQNLGDARSYICSLIVQVSATFDCSTQTIPGLQATISNTGISIDSCTGKDFGTIALAFDGVPDTIACVFQCSIL